MTVSLRRWLDGVEFQGKFNASQNDNYITCLKYSFRSSRCGATGSSASWERWDAGSVLSQAQRVKDPALPQLRLRSHLWLGSDPWPRSSICRGLAKKTKQNKTKQKHPHSFHKYLLKILWDLGSVLDAERRAETPFPGKLVSLCKADSE